MRDLERSRGSRANMRQNTKITTIKNCCNHAAFTNPASCNSRPSLLLPHPTCKMLELKSFSNTFIKYLGRNRISPSSKLQPGTVRPGKKKQLNISQASMVTWRHCIKLDQTVTMAVRNENDFCTEKDRKIDCMQIFLTMTCSSKFMSCPDKRPQVFFFAGRYPGELSVAQPRSSAQHSGKNK